MFTHIDNILCNPSVINNSLGELGRRLNIKLTSPQHEAESSVARASKSKNLHDTKSQPKGIEKKKVIARSDGSTQTDILNSQRPTQPSHKGAGVATPAKAGGGKVRALPSIFKSQAVALAQERKSDNKRFLFLYFIIPIFFATLGFSTAAPNRRQIILKNQKKQLHSLIKLMLASGSVIRNQRKKNFLPAFSTAAAPRRAVRQAGWQAGWLRGSEGMEVQELKKKKNQSAAGVDAVNAVDAVDAVDAATAQLKLTRSGVAVKRPEPANIEKKGKQKLFSSVTAMSDLLKWSILFIAHSLAPLKRKQEYYSLILVKILEAKGILALNKINVRSMFNITASTVYPTKLQRLAARYHGSPQLPSNVSKQDLLDLISNNNPELNLGLGKSVALRKDEIKKVNKFKPGVRLGKTGIALANIKSTNTFNYQKASQLQSQVKRGSVDSLSVMKEAQRGIVKNFDTASFQARPTLDSPELTRFTSQALHAPYPFPPLKKEENRQRKDGDKALLQTELKKASITFYPGGRFLSD